MFENENENQNLNQESNEKPREYYYTSGNFSGAYSGNSYNQQGSGSTPNNKKNKKSGGFGKKVGSAVCLGLVFGVVAGAAFSVPAYLTNQQLLETKAAIEAAQNDAAASQTTGDLSDAPSSDSSISSTTNSIGQSASTTTSSTTIENIASSCLPSVVSITNKGVSEVTTYFGTYSQDTTSSGSGIIIGKNDSELLIVTNYHVVSASKELTVVFSYDESNDEPNAVSAKIKGYDEDKDLAVIAVDLANVTDEMKSQIKIATLGDSSSLQLGEQVVAIGNALGYGQSVTTGIISALNREVTVTNDNGTTITNKLIQTDAAINPGNSGGALLNMNGELIGINSVKVSNSSVEGMGYAIPISDVSDIISELMLKETRDVVDSSERGYIGIKGGQDVSESISEAYGIPVGVYISSVYADSPAEQAGLQKGYIITKFDGQTVKTLSELQSLIAYYKAGETVEIIAYVQSSEGYTAKTFTVTLGYSSIFGDDANTSSSSDSPSSGDSNSGNGNGDNGSSSQNPYSNYYNFFWPFGNR